MSPRKGSYVMKDNEMNPVLGIDLGTTCCCVYKWSGSDVEIFLDKAGNPTTPSLVYFGEKETVVGGVAKRKGGMDPDYFVSKIKREMGNRDFQLEIRGKSYKPEDISAIILKRLVDNICDKYPEASGFKIGGAVITVPYYFKTPERNATLEAGQKAGINVMGLINEPTAAALYLGWGDFLKKDQSERKTMLVFDLGGGTFDITLFSLHSTSDKIVFQVLGTGGDARLGGVDFDEAFENYVLKKTGISLDGLEEKERLRAHTLLNEAVRVSKEELAEMHSSFLAVPHVIPGQHVELDITREEFDGIIQPYLDRIRKILDETLSASRVEPNRIDKVIKIGGSSRICSVDKLIKEATGLEPYDAARVDHAVAQGAALYAAIMDGRIDFEKEIEIKQIASHSLGVRAGDAIFWKLIEEGAAIPCEVSQTFGTTEDNATALDIDVYQGRGTTVDEDGVTKIGHIPVTGLVPLPEAQLDIDITFTMDNDQDVIVKVSVEQSSVGGKDINIVEKLMQFSESD